MKTDENIKDIRENECEPESTDEVTPTDESRIAPDSEDSEAALTHDETAVDEELADDSPVADSADEESANDSPADSADEETSDVAVSTEESVAESIDEADVQDDGAQASVNDAEEVTGDEAVAEDEDVEYSPISDSEPITESVNNDPTDGDAQASVTEVKREKKQTKERRIDSIFDFVELFVFTLAAVFLITTFFFKYSIVEGGSMSNTLHDNDRLIISCFMYEPECGDVVVLEDLSTELKKPIVKRVIAVGGQTVRFTSTDVYVDGVKLNELYVYTGDYKNILGQSDAYKYSVYPDDSLLHLVTAREDGKYYEITVPEGEIFVMGDHRNASNDSRTIGTVHEDSILGKVVLRFYPTFEKID